MIMKLSSVVSEYWRMSIVGIIISSKINSNIILGDHTPNLHLKKDNWLYRYIPAIWSIVVETIQLELSLVLDCKTNELHLSFTGKRHS